MVVTRHPRVETLGYYWSRICAPCGRTTSALIIAQDFSPGWPCVQASDKEVAQDFSPGWPCVQVLGSRQKKRRPFGRLFYCLDKRLRSCSCRRILRRRMDFGVTSTYSSPWMYSRASSKLKVMGVTMRTLSSEPEARILVSFLLLVTLITRSPSRLFSPMT